MALNNYNGYTPLATPKRNRVYAQLKNWSAAPTSPTDCTATFDEDPNKPGQIVINFPAMPETIELLRTANYKNLVRTQGQPDGNHFYQNTEPLEIPLKFSVHAYDIGFTGVNGAVTLLHSDSYKNSSYLGM